jgi:hypothetical protein
MMGPLKVGNLQGEISLRSKSIRTVWSAIPFASSTIRYGMERLPDIVWWSRTNMAAVLEVWFHLVHINNAVAAAVCSSHDKRCYDRGLSVASRCELFLGEALAKLLHSIRCQLLLEPDLRNG